MASPPLSPLLLLLFLSSVTIASGAEDQQSDRAALVAFSASFPHLQSRWNSTTSPCSWTGIICKSVRVAAICLSDVYLMGRIPTGCIGNLTGLRILSIRHNSLFGSLPPDIAGATRLRNLDLQGNRLSGEIPPALSSLRHLKRLNLAFNRFSGGIPHQFCNLTRLTTLLLERNRLSGKLPDIDLPMLTRFNVSYNRFSGTIPARLRKWPSSAFLGMLLCGSPLPACVVGISSAPVGGLSASRKKSKLSRGVIAVIAIALISVVSAINLYCSRLRRGKENNLETTGDDAGEYPPATSVVEAAGQHGENVAEDVPLGDNGMKRRKTGQKGIRRKH